jgi:hypothetical protein
MAFDKPEALASIPLASAIKSTDRLDVFYFPRVRCDRIEGMTDMMEVRYRYESEEEIYNTSTEFTSTVKDVILSIVRTGLAPLDMELWAGAVRLPYDDEIVQYFDPGEVFTLRPVRALGLIEGVEFEGELVFSSACEEGEFARPESLRRIQVRMR